MDTFKVFAGKVVFRVIPRVQGTLFQARKRIERLMNRIDRLAYRLAQLLPVE